MPEQKPFRLPPSPIVDIHTHMYPPPYVELLKSRSALPYIRTFPDSDSNSDSELRLIILPSEDSPSTPSTARGRPVGPSYWDVEEKLAFMDKHGIDVSVISLANPWLDFVTDPQEALEMAKKVNDWFEEVGQQRHGRLFGFGVLPMRAGVKAIVEEIRRLKGLRWIRGVIMGTTGMGSGLDDPSFTPVWEALAETETIVFLHPHYGLPSELYGLEKAKYGHVLPLALGFPLETTIAITRMILSGIFGRLPNLRILLAHSGGTLPFLAGRIQSCIDHDGHFRDANIDVWDILKRNIYLDAVIYSDVGIRTAVEAVGGSRVLFGTDHPFFPPLEGGQGKWASVETNYKAIAKGLESPDAKGVLGNNAVEILNLRIG